ncbi:MAG: hypothetical protein ACETWR_12910, partial [Anaerolineae bacterium]
MACFSLTGMQFERSNRCEVDRDREGRAVTGAWRFITSTRAVVAPDIIDGRNHRRIEIQIYPEVVGNRRGTDILDGHYNVIGTFCGRRGIESDVGDDQVASWCWWYYPIPVPHHEGQVDISTCWNSSENDRG